MRVQVMTMSITRVACVPHVVLRLWIARKAIRGMDLGLFVPCLLSRCWQESLTAVAMWTVIAFPGVVVVLG